MHILRFENNGTDCRHPEIGRVFLQSKNDAVTDCCKIVDLFWCSTCGALGVRHVQRNSTHEPDFLVWEVPSGQF